MLNGVTSRSTLVAIACAVALSAHAMADTPGKVDVPAGELAAALQKLAEQSGVEFVYSVDQLKGVRTLGVHGEYTIENAVTKLLEGTKLKLTVHESGAMLISPLNAADTPSTSHKSAVTTSLEEVVVTGTRIASANLQSISPVAVLTKQDMARTGKTRIEDIINQLPQAFAGQGENIANGATGTATVDLRGLGASRTLVLINGRRMMAGDANGGSAADLNQIPLTLVKRVEVLTGGAASVYGADAVAGVVNFITDTEFEGLRFEGNYSFYEHGNDLDSVAARAVTARGFELPESRIRNGYASDFTFMLGAGGPDDRGHATFYGTYREVDAVTQAEYDFSTCTLNSGSTFTCGGSSVSNPGRYIAVDPNTGFIATNDTIAAGNVLRPFLRTDQNNFAPLNHFQRPDKRYTAGVFMDYDMNETMQVYSELMFMDDRSVAQVAPSGAFGSSYRINCDNPLLSPSMVQAWCADFGLAATDFATVLVSRRNTEGGPREQDLGHESIRLVGGFRDHLTQAWQVDAYLAHATTKGDTSTFQDFSISRTERALQVRNVAGVPTCISAIDGTDPNCVPWNIFQLAGVNVDALKYLQVPGTIRAEAVQQIAHADFTGDLTHLIKSRTAELGPVVNIGAEYRDESSEYLPDGVLQAGDLAGQGQAFSATVGGFRVKEVFAETRVPLVERKAGIQSLSVESGYRYSKYSTGFQSDTYKAGIDWAPIKSLRFRGSYQRAVRAPDVGELFGAQFVRGDGTVDPCEGILGNASSADDPSASLAQCLRTGMTAAQYGTVPQNPIAQYNGLIGGNREVRPEQADTVAFGLVFKPDFANLIAVVDYFQIKVNDVISNGDETSGNANLYLSSCLSSGEPFFCNLIHRDQFGSLWIQPSGYIVDTNLNLGRLTTRGIDLQTNYSVDIGRHQLAINLAGTLLKELSTTPLPGGDSFDCVGFFGTTCGTPKPKWRYVLRSDWKTPWTGLNVSASWRYFGSTSLDSSSTDSQLAGNVPPTDANLRSVSYFDLTVAIPFGDSYFAQIGANNVLDKDPPLVGFANCPVIYCNGNTFAQVYDTMGRQYFMTLGAKF